MPHTVEKLKEPEEEVVVLGPGALSPAPHLTLIRAEGQLSAASC